jgi:outer membrane protein assembly factor BamB
MHISRSMRHLASLLFILLVIGPASSATSQEWTRFRGPNGTGVSQAKNIPTTWTEEDYEWRVSLPGMGHSSPVVWGDRLFLHSADPKDATRYLLCLDTKSGALQWQRTYGSQTHALHLRNSFASSTPAVDEQHVYAAWATPEALMLKAFTHKGEEVWSQNLGPWVSQHGFGTSPILYRDMVILSNSQQGEQLTRSNGSGQSGWAMKQLEKPGESFMMAFDRQTGELRWKTPRSTTTVCYTTPCIYQAAGKGDQLICYNTGDGIFSLDPLTGKPNWAVDVFKMRNVNSPVMVGDVIFGSNGSGGGGNYLVAVQAGQEPKEIYRVTRQAPYVPTPVATDDLLFLLSDKGIASCLEAADGKVVWRKRLDGLAFSGSPVVVEDRIYCIDESGVVIALAASRRFQELGRMPLGEPSRSTPAIAGDRMFLRTESQLFCVGQP